eukprot:CAMPEP_0113869128 /NCGR_PEP_ID=MMETSP0780_2-20120614/1366_1 /TAXON_ID=652834 /ORGANISM="Palpitomonas bilix" /LENGTH=370 /DNA_ID=CAMNT_0000854275 /DNA_START=143 /DNA_END=1256 /DNA_ORIENTATION=+ /assembly_acc=CAM_ASM_000599
MPRNVGFKIQEVSPSLGKDKTVAEDGAHGDFSSSLFSMHKREELSRKLFWEEKPRTVLFTKKPRDAKSALAASRMSKWLTREHGIKCLVKPEMAGEFDELGHECDDLYTYSPEEASLIPTTVDLVVTLGGDGTILHSAGLFTERVPPLLPFAMGTLGFLTPFSVKDFKETFSNCLDISKGRNACNEKARLECLIIEKDEERELQRGSVLDRFLIMNDVVVRRFTRPIVLPIHTTVDGLDLVQYGGDGLVIATPTGSTAYSMSCGGSLVHPCIEGILFTPICPSSALNRPSIMRDDSVFCVEVKRTASVISDGVEGRVLKPGQKLQVTSVEFPVYTIHRRDDITAWVSDINDCLRWNEDLNERRSGDIPTA